MVLSGSRQTVELNASSRRLEIDEQLNPAVQQGVPLGNLDALETTVHVRAGREQATRYDIAANGVELR